MVRGWRLREKTYRFELGVVIAGCESDGGGVTDENMNPKFGDI